MSEIGWNVRYKETGGEEIIKVFDSRMSEASNFADHIDNKVKGPVFLYFDNRLIAPANTHRACYYPCHLD